VPISTLDAVPALVLVDLQKGITASVGAPLPTATVLANGAALAAAFRAHGLPVVLVNVDSGAPGRTEAARPPAGPRPDDWAELADELGVQPSDVLVTKHTWGAFHGTALHDELTRRGVTQVVLGGISTSIGVETTARQAFEHGYHVVLATDAMTDRDETMHAHSVGKVFPRLGETGTTADVLGLLAAR
jgi:nicotinamidase-related amidase